MYCNSFRRSSTFTKISVASKIKANESNRKPGKCYQGELNFKSLLINQPGLSIAGGDGILNPLFIFKILHCGYLQE